MATYGTKEGNYFKADPNDQYGKNLQNLNYSLTIDDENSTTPGKITIYSSVPNNPSTIKEIGTIPRGETFSPTPGQTTSTELEYFSQPDVITSVKNQAKITTEKSLYDLGVTDYQQRSTQANSLIDGPEQTPSPTDPADPAAPDSTGSTRDPEVDPSVDNPTTIIGSEITQKIGKSSGRDSFDNYYYPLEMQSNKQDRIIFTLKEITGSTITPTLERGTKSVQRNTLTTINGSVTLPIQSGITDSNSVDWSGSTLNSIQAYAAGASMTFMESEDAGELGNNVSSILGKIAQKIKGNSDYGNALKLYLAQEAVGINGLLSRATGAILNPNLELLFNGPQLRPFNFTFRLSPRDSKEATQVRSIIRFFKEAMSVRTSSDNVFLKSPFVFDIKYITYDANGNKLENHPSINRIKTCALLSCDVDYTPDGSYMTFNDSARTMTSYGLSLRFSELDPIYNTDYTDSENTNNNIPVDNIGY